MPRRAAITVLAAVAVTVLAWASAFVGIRAVGADLSPGRPDPEVQRAAASA